MLTQQPTRSLSLVSSDGGRFTINSSTGVVTVAGALTAKRWADSNITVRATSADGSFTDQAYTITINDVDEFDVGAVTIPTRPPTQSTKMRNRHHSRYHRFCLRCGRYDNGITYSLANDDSGRFTSTAPLVS